MEVNSVKVMFSKVNQGYLLTNYDLIALPRSGKGFYGKPCKTMVGLIG